MEKFKVFIKDSLLELGISNEDFDSPIWGSKIYKDILGAMKCK
ncbi:MAG: hypothetical protein E6876_04390 [Clostridium sp.]|nr:hypothetical protein [Clostridium sp.]